MQSIAIAFIKPELEYLGTCTSIVIANCSRIAMFSYSGIVVFLFVLLLSDLPVTYPQDIDQLCSVSGGGITDKSRFGVIRDDLLAKLNLFLPLDTTEALSNDSSQLDRPRQIDPALVMAYEVAARVGADPKASGCSDSDSGRGTPSFAKRISLFFPENSSLAYLPPELLTSHRHKNEQGERIIKSYTCKINYSKHV